MTLQVRKKDGGDERFVDANRDMAHCFPNLVLGVAQLVDSERWPVFRDYLRTHNVEADELNSVMNALCAFTQNCLTMPEETMDECLRRSGFYSCRQEAVFAYLAGLGSVVLGGVFSGRRVAYMGEGTVHIPYSLMSAAKRFVMISGMPRWKRKLYFFFRDIKRSFRRLRSKGST